MTLLFQGVRINKLHTLIEEIFLLNNGCYRNEKKKTNYFNYHSCKADKILHQKHEYFTYDLVLLKLSWLDQYKARKNVATSKSYILRKKFQKLKDILTFHDIHSFALKREIGSATRLIQPILETRNVNACMRVRFTFLDIKYLFESSKINNFWTTTVSF